MANVIKHKRGSGSDPSASNLVIGELAIRTDNGKLFTKMDSGAIAEIAGGGSDIAINTLSSSSGTGGGSATFNGSAYRFTLSSPPSVSAAQLLVSVNGVIQKPVAGTGQPSEGFSVDGNDIIFGDAPATGADFFILTFRSLGVSEPADNSVTSAKIVDGAIVNADINASAAIAGTKIDPSFTSNITITNTAPIINFTDSDNNSDYRIVVQGGEFFIQDTTNSNATRLRINSSGTVVAAGNLDVGAGLDVTGDITATGNLSITSAAPQIFLTDSNANSDYAIVVNTGQFRIRDETNSANRLAVNSDGHVDIYNRLDAQGGLEITGVTTTTGRVNIGDTQMSQNLLNVEDGTAAAIDIASHGSGGDTAYIGVKKSTGGGLTLGISNRDIIFKTGATYNNGTTFDSGTERLRITSTGTITIPDGGIGIGTTSPATLTHIYDSTNTSSSTEQFRISGGNRTADSFETGFRFFTESPSANGNRHIRFTSNGNTGLTIQPIETSSGNSAVDRNISLCPDGGNVGIGGNLIIATSGKGIDFSATSDGSGTTSSELLDDYEEGIFTPTLKSNTTTTGQQNGIGKYTKIGNMVHCIIDFEGKNFSSIPDGGVVGIVNMPFTSATSNYTPTATVPMMYKIYTRQNQTFYIGSNSTTVFGIYPVSGAGWANVPTNDINQIDVYLNFSLTYFTS